ncbi:MAG: glycosyltransferase family 4 protein [Endomicrobiales bacterium]|nr:glycosyltransferase family 4 protein [Endomicrobiales bacterium]
MSKKRSILQLHWGFPPTIGGVETHLTILLPGLVRKGYKVGLITSSAEKAKAYETYNGASVWRSPLFDLNWLSKRGFEGLEEELRSLYAKVIDKIKPDIVHCHNMHYFSRLHTSILENMCQKKGIGLVLTAHNMWDDITCLRLTRLVKWDHIIAVSHFIKKELMGIGIDPFRVTVVHHGVDESVFAPKKPPYKIIKKHPYLKNKRIILHPCRIGMAKGCHVSIKAMRVIKKKYPNAVLVTSGSKNIIDWGGTQQHDIAYFVSMIKAFNLKKNVYIDFFALDEMPELYNLASVCVYPSIAPEPFGLTMLEALATEKPMIVSKMGGMPEIIRDNINGFVVPVHDYDVLATRIMQLLGDKVLSRRLGQTGKEIVHTHYSKEIMIKDTIYVYDKVLK